jgi:ribosomal-protein-alanine N-acetyltransferase
MAVAWALRAGGEEDIRAMYMLDLVCFDEPFRFTLAAMRRFVLQRGAIVLVAEADGRLAGFVVVHRLRKAQAYVVTLDVATEFRRRGLARALIAAAEWQAVQVGMEAMALHVYTENETAVAFYERLGFPRGELCAAFYGAGLDAWVYSKAIGQEAHEVIAQG